MCISHFVHSFNHHHSHNHSFIAFKQIKTLYTSVFFIYLFVCLNQVQIHSFHVCEIKSIQFVFQSTKRRTHTHNTHIQIEMTFKIHYHTLSFELLHIYCRPIFKSFQFFFHPFYSSFINKN